MALLPPGTILHIQDIYLESTIQKNTAANPKSFLQSASDDHFEGRSFLDHRCRLFLTRRPATRRLNGPGISSLLSRSILPRETLNQPSINDFLRVVGQFDQLLNDSGLVATRRLTEEDILGDDQTAGIIEQFCQLSFHPADPGTSKPIATINDISLEGGIRIGDKQCILYSLADAAHLPARCSPALPYTPYNSGNYTVPVGFATSLGPLLNCTHIYNQYLFVEDPYQIIRKLELKRRRLHSMSLHSRENIQVRDAVDQFLNAITGEQQQLVKAHFNIFSWATNTDTLERNKKLIASAIAQMGATPHLETVSAPQIWFAGMPGNSGDMPSSELFDMLADQAVCFLMSETNYRNAG